MRSLLTSALVSLALAAAPVAHAAAPVRASAPSEADSQIGGSLPISVLIVLATVIAGAIVLVVDDNNHPDSP